jgi:two-component system OmpR family response regulator
MSACWARIAADAGLVRAVMRYAPQAPGTNHRALDPSKGPPMRLLIVEDFDPLRKTLVRGFEDQGFAVDATGDGAEGLWYATSNDYDVIILDIMLPGKSGLEILTALRATEKDIPVLLLTAKDEVDDRVRGLNLGADDYLTKPFAVPELLARVRSLTRRGHHRRNPLITIGDLSIDTTQRLVTRGATEIALTPKDYALLEYLALRVGNVVSRTEIWEHVYSFIDESTSNVVEAAVMRLRKKLSPQGEPQIIHTRRGFGYVLSHEGSDT